MSRLVERLTAQPAEPDELLFLRFFYNEARKGMGPADSDIYDMIKEDFVEQSGLQLPPSYRPEDE